jgi:hypothetical protein
VSVTVVEIPRKTHRGRRFLIVTLIVVVVLVALFFVADALARQYATNYVRTQVASSLGLRSDAPVRVDLGSGSLLLQAATGRIDHVTITVDPLTLNGLSGAAGITGRGVPLSTTVPVKSLNGEVRIPAATIRKAIKQIPSLASYEPTVSVVNNHVDVAATVSILGFPQRLGITLTPKVTNAKPGLAIDAITFDGARISAAALDKLIPGVAGVLHTGVSLCIANQLPKAFVLTGISFKGQSLVITFTGDGVELNSAALAEKGTCPAT